MSSASKANVQKFRIIRKAVAFVGKLHNKNLLEKRFQDEASMVLKESMYTAQCIAKKGREREDRRVVNVNVNVHQYSTTHTALCIAKKGRERGGRRVVNGAQNGKLRSETGPGTLSPKLLESRIPEFQNSRIPDSRFHIDQRRPECAIPCTQKSRSYSDKQPCS